MPVVFKKGETLGRGDLDIFLTNSQGNPANAAEITYEIFFVSPGPPETEVLIPPSNRTPVNPAVGEYYASLLVPQTANIGTYRVRWTFKEFVNSPQRQVVQEWAVVEESTILTPGFTQVQQDCINKLRILLRDNCVGGEELVELNVNGELMLVRLDELYEAIHE